jgi:hypothetical protein
MNTVAPSSREDCGARHSKEVLAKVCGIVRIWFPPIPEGDDGYKKNGITQAHFHYISTRKETGVNHDIFAREYNDWKGQMKLDDLIAIGSCQSRRNAYILLRSSIDKVADSRNLKFQIWTVLIATAWRLSPQSAIASNKHRPFVNFSWAESRAVTAPRQTHLYVPSMPLLPRPGVIPAQAGRPPRRIEAQTT